MRKVVTSAEWRTVQKASRELKYLPNRLMREASLEDLSKDFTDINKIGKELNNDVRQVQSDLSSWTTPPELMHTDEPTPENIPSPKPDPTPSDDTESARSKTPGQMTDPDPESQTD
jgi:hypothetical protein